MDTALLLRKKADAGELVENPMEYLNHSALVQKIIRQDQLTPLGKLFSLVGLSEIPYSLELPYTQALIQYSNEQLATAEGFSFTGKLEEIVPCYNAMLLTAYCNLGLGESIEAQNALNWIINYQVLDRNEKTTWPHKGICKFGGCMKATPCYIGIGKTVRALLTYQEKVNAADSTVNQLIEKGMNYMLRHKMFLRLSQDQPISPHITESMFPQSYVLSLTDLVFILGKSGKQCTSQAQPLLHLLEEKRTKSDGWKIDYIYNYKGYTAFETRRKNSEWLTYLYREWLKKS